MPLSEHVYCEAIAFKMTKWVEQWICIKFYVRLEHSSVETIQMIQKATAMENWWLAASSPEHTCSRIMSDFWWNIETPKVTQPHYSPDLVPHDFWLFPKLKSPLKGKRFQTINESGKYDGAADGNWENCVRSQSAHFEGDRGVIALCTMFFVPCIFFSKCLYFFHSARLDTCWTDLVYSTYCMPSAAESHFRYINSVNPHQLPYKVAMYYPIFRDEETDTWLARRSWYLDSDSLALETLYF